MWKRVAWTIGGIVLGYLVVALTLGWVVSSETLMVLLYLAGMTVGGVVAWRRRQPKLSG